MPHLGNVGENLCSSFAVLSSLDALIDIIPFEHYGLVFLVFFLLIYLVFKYCGRKLKSAANSYSHVLLLLGLQLSKPTAWSRLLVLEDVWHELGNLGWQSAGGPEFGAVVPANDMMTPHHFLLHPEDPCCLTLFPSGAGLKFGKGESVPVLED